MRNDLITKVHCRTGKQGQTDKVLIFQNPVTPFQSSDFPVMCEYWYPSPTQALIDRETVSSHKGREGASKGLVIAFRATLETKPSLTHPNILLFPAKFLQSSAMAGETGMVPIV